MKAFQFNTTPGIRFGSDYSVGTAEEVSKKLGNKIENGKLMFIYQAFLAFNIWHGIKPKIDNEVINLLD